MQFISSSNIKIKTRKTKCFVIGKKWQNENLILIRKSIYSLKKRKRVIYHCQKQITDCNLMLKIDKTRTKPSHAIVGMGQTDQ